MARNEQDDRNREQSYSPNTRDFDREYNQQGSQGSRRHAGRDRGGFENYYSGNADRWTGYDEGPQHWREGRGREGDFERERSGREGLGGGYERDEWSRTGNWSGSTYGSGVSNYSAVGPFSSPDSGGGHVGMGSGYGGGMGSYAGRMRGPHAGRGPRNYRRSDERIREEINDRLTDHPDIDPSDVEVTVAAGIVTLTGTVEDRHAKRLAEDITDGVAGVSDVNNQIRVRRHGEKQSEEEVDKQPVTTLGINPGDRKLKSTESK